MLTKTLYYSFKKENKKKIKQELINYAHYNLITSAVSKYLFLLFNPYPTLFKSALLTKVVITKSLWPSCLNCLKNDQLVNDYCNLNCLKRFLKIKANPNHFPCQHPLRNNDRVIIGWSDSCDCIATVKSLLSAKTHDISEFRNVFDNYLSLAFKDLDYSQLYWIVPTIDKKLHWTANKSRNYLKSFNATGQLVVSILEQGSQESYHNNLLTLLTPDQLNIFRTLHPDIFIKKVNNTKHLHLLLNYLTKELITPKDFTTKVIFASQIQTDYLNKLKALNNASSYYLQHQDSFKKARDKYWARNKDQINLRRREKGTKKNWGN